MGCNPLPASVQGSSWGCILWLRLLATKSHLLRSPLWGAGGLVGGRGRNWERCGCLKTGFPESLLGAPGLPWGCLVNSLKRSGASSEGDKHLTKARFPTLSVSVTRPKA